MEQHGSQETIDLSRTANVKPFDFNEALSQRYSTVNNEKNESVKDETSGSNPLSAPKRVKSSFGKRTLRAEVPTLRYADLGGIEPVLEEIRDVVERPFRFASLYRYLGVEPVRGVLLHGAPGCGKSSLALAIAGELNIPIIKVAAPELVAGMSGESEGRIRELFDSAKASAPCLLFIDEIDAIATKRDTAQREMERRIVAQILACMDELANAGASIMVIGATNRPDALDPALRRAGRFDREIQLSIPNEAARLKILKVLTEKLRIAGEVDFVWLARNTPGYVGADLKALTQEAANSAIKRILDAHPLEAQEAELDEEQLRTAFVEAHDFAQAMKKIQPSAKREGFAVVPTVQWSDIGALQRIRDELRMAVVEPLRHPEKFAAVGLSAPTGVLLWGPPGCGKTLLAKAVANESHSNFISVKGPELLNKYVGESERAVRQVFERARHSAPCIVFFDELDALCPRRSDESDAASRVVNQLLTEMDGLEDRRQVFVLAATNRPDMIDPAMTRPGRLDKLLYVSLPTAEERVEILKTVGRNTPWASNVDLCQMAKDHRCEAFSGADMAALVREASLAAVRESLEAGDMMDSITITRDHIEAAFARIVRSVSPNELASYERLRLEKLE